MDQESRDEQCWQAGDVFQKASSGPDNSRGMDIGWSWHDCGTVRTG